MGGSSHRQVFQINCFKEKGKKIPNELLQRILFKLSFNLFFIISCTKLNVSFLSDHLLEFCFLQELIQYYFLLEFWFFVAKDLTRFAIENLHVLNKKRKLLGNRKAFTCFTYTNISICFCSYLRQNDLTYFRSEEPKIKKYRFPNFFRE